MAKKENKGGVLSNEQVEQDNKVKGKAEVKNTSYIGSQDTGISQPAPAKEDLRKKRKP